MMSQLLAPIVSMLTPRIRRRLRDYRVHLRDLIRGETAESLFDIHNPDELNGLLRRLGLPDKNPSHYSASHPTRNAWKARLAYQQRPDIREAIPLGLTPMDRGLLLAWLVTHGTREVGFDVEDALTALFAQDTDVGRGIAETYRLQPRWQSAVPDGLTPTGWPKLKAWLTSEYGFDSHWFRTAFRPQDEPRDASDVLVMGLFRYASGLQQAALGMVHSLEQAGLQVGLREIPGPALRENYSARPLDAMEHSPVTIVHTALDMPVRDAYWRAGLTMREGVYRIGYWWWELEAVPEEWRNRGQDVQEIWAPTRFIADALRVLGRPVYPMLPGVELGTFSPMGKVAFGMSPNRFTFVVLFDINSRLERKNPLAAIRAFRQAFRLDDPVEMIVKMTPPGLTAPPGLPAIRAACEESRITLIEQQMSREETLAFLHAGDCLVSLHRSEGFGLPLAEAMLLGKPVIATGYSGNLDFMNHENSYLVDYYRTPIVTNDPPYHSGFVWAEPSVEHAAKLMRRVYERRDESDRIGNRAQGELRELLSYAHAGQRMRTRLNEITQAQP
ncbi:MAG: glycosyltransferase [Bacteroidales bacterium]|nr:glycosyltransferase [Bacteroidales bacterium]